MTAYDIKVYQQTEKMGDILIARIVAGWKPDDPDRFAWELGGTKIVIEEIESNTPPQN